MNEVITNDEPRSAADLPAQIERRSFYEVNPPEQLAFERAVDMGRECLVQCKATGLDVSVSRIGARNVLFAGATLTGGVWHMVVPTADAKAREAMIAAFPELMAGA